MPLTSLEEFKRIKEIIETGCFWCAKFSELNDPMEGVFSTYDETISSNIYNRKKNYKICSFSTQDGFSTPTLWGYYAEGFKGVAIEVDVSENDVYKVEYCNEVQLIETCNTVDLQTILTRKLTPWKYEYEYRYLKESDLNRFKIGDITGVYYGVPYANVVNKSDIMRDNPHLNKYREWLDMLQQILSSTNIDFIPVRIDGIEVIPDVKNEFN